MRVCWKNRSPKLCICDVFNAVCARTLREGRVRTLNFRTLNTYPQKLIVKPNHPQSVLSSINTSRVPHRPWGFDAIGENLKRLIRRSAQNQFWWNDKNMLCVWQTDLWCCDGPPLLSNIILLLVWQRHKKVELLSRKKVRVLTTF